MGSGCLESKKLALIRIWEILKEYSDYNHPMTQEQIADKLKSLYGIVLERKAISRNISLLNEAGVEIHTGREGSYLLYREFEDSELRLLIDSVLSSRHITAKQSKDLIDRICGLSSIYFRSSVKHIFSVNEWFKSDNQSLFYNIEVIGEAIDGKKQISFDYNKFGIDKKLHVSSHQCVSPYTMILHNQRYYLMAFNEHWKDMSFYRLDHITDISVETKQATPIKSIPGYENGLNYRELSSSTPYMYADKPEWIELTAEEAVIDQIIDWFGFNARITKSNVEGKINIRLKASPNAMEHWAIQYINYVEVTSPESLRNKIKESLENGIKKYQ